jgi:hypothetical protein
MEAAAPPAAWSGNQDTIEDAIHDAIVVGINAITTGFTFLVKSRRPATGAAEE